MLKKIFILVIGLSFISGICSFAQNYGNYSLPGNSVANTKLQQDTLGTVFMAVATKEKDCKNMRVTNTKVTKQPYDLKYKGQQIVGGYWDEIWTVNACSKTYDVPIKFILDETGASYVISPKNIISK